MYSSNVFAILGLRALYFLLAGVIHRFHYLKVGLSIVLVFVGAKMLAADVYKIPIGVSLGVIVLVLMAAVAASLRWPRPAGEPVAVQLASSNLQRPRKADRETSSPETSRSCSSLFLLIVGSGGVVD